MFLGYQKGKIKFYTEKKINEPTVERWEETQDKYILNGDENEYVLVDEKYQEEKALERKAEFEKQFFNIEGVGYYRRQPKGYSSALESVNTAFNAVTIMGKLPANTLTFYQAPDFAIEEQCTEEWLVANSFKNAEMTAQEFGQFYEKFITAWNTQEHL